MNPDTPTPGARSPLSTREAGDFARQLAGLTEAGLPLGPGLRALAAELPPGRLPAMLRDTANRIEAGESLNAALLAEGAKFPAPLRGLIAAGARTGRLPETLGRYLAVSDLGRTLRRRLQVGLIYPAMMLLVSFVLFVFVAMVTVHGFESIFRDFGVDVPYVTELLLTASRGFAATGWWVLISPIVAVAVVWAAMRITLGPADRAQLLHRTPLIGPLARDSALAQFCPVLAMMIESEIPLPEAIRLAGDSSPDAAMREAAQAMADDASRGRSLAEAARDRPPFPRGFDQFLAWAEPNRGLVDALRLSAETFEARARARAEFVARFCNVVTMTVVLWWVGLTVVALFLPLIQLMNALGGSGSSFMGSMGVLTFGSVFVVGVVVVAAIARLAWPFAYRAATVAASETRDRQRARFWYYGAMGWTLIGASMVFVIADRIMLATWEDSVPAWWVGDLGMMSELLAVAVAGAGVLMIALAWASARWRRGSAKVAETTLGERVRIRPRGVRFGLRHLMFAMAPIALALVLVRELGWSLAAVAGVLLPPVGVVVVSLSFSNRRASQRESLLRVMAMAAREGQPLGPALAAFAPTCRGFQARRVVELSARLNRGDSLPDALSCVPGVLSRSGEFVARVGWDTGTLSRMLDDAIAADEATKSTRAAAVGSITYPLGVMAAIVGIGGFLVVLLGQSLPSIFRDFEVEMPEPSRWFFSTIGHWLGFLSRGADLSGAIVAGALLAIAAALVVGMAFFMARMIVGRLPWFERIGRRQHTALILRALAAAVDAGRTLPSALERLGACYPRPSIRKRVRWGVGAHQPGRPLVPVAARGGPDLQDRRCAFERRRARGQSRLGDARGGRRRRAPDHVSPRGARTDRSDNGDRGLGRDRLPVRDRLFSTARDPDRRDGREAGMRAEKRRSRRAFLLLETITAGLLVGLAMVLTVRLLAWSATQRRSAERRGWAVQEAANVMETLAAAPFAELDDATAAQLAKGGGPGALPGHRLRAAVRTEPDGMKRIDVAVTWRGAAGIDDAPVRLTHWVAQKGADR